MKENKSPETLKVEGFFFFFLMMGRVRLKLGILFLS